MMFITNEAEYLQFTVFLWVLRNVFYYFLVFENQ